MFYFCVYAAREGLGRASVRPSTRRRPHARAPNAMMTTRMTTTMTMATIPKTRNAAVGRPARVVTTRLTTPVVGGRGRFTTTASRPTAWKALVAAASAAEGGEEYGAAAASDDDVAAAYEETPTRRTVVPFTRTKEKDPYKRLGIDKDATSEEVSSAFNYLIREHAGDERGVESIEAAYDKVISERLTTRKMQKGLRRLKKEKKGDEVDYDAPIVQRIKFMFAKPDQQTLIRRTLLYVIISGWAIAQPATSGPAFQMACAFGACVYFLNEKRGGQGTLGKAFRDSLIALVLAWLVGSIVPVYIPLFPQGMAPELILALFSFVAMWATCTFLK